MRLISVSQDDLSEQRPLVELKEPFPRGVILFEHLGADDVTGHQVGRELDAVEHQIDGLRQRADQQGFPQTRQSFEQAVSPGEKGGQQLLDHGLLPDDHLADLCPQTRDFFEQGVDLRFVGRRVGHGEEFFHAVMAWTMILTPNLVLSSARKRLLRKS